jgi:hypothetical protein
MPQPLSWDSGLAWDTLTPGIAWDGLAPTTNTNRPMASDNRISVEITAAQKTAIVDAVMALKAALQGITKVGVSESLCFGSLVMFWSGVVF